MRKAVAVALAVWALAARAALPKPPDCPDGSQAFELFRKLAGSWRAKSTKGWTERLEFQVIGRGAVVLETSRFDGPDPSPMANVIVWDGDRLLLTHYCEAGNQPRLQLTGCDPALGDLTFTFLDGTNLPSRDAGHMDKVVFHLADPNHFSSRWTWYQNGQERWLEDISYERLR
jgi:hypothetical protein